MCVCVCMNTCGDPELVIPSTTDVNFKLSDSQLPSGRYISNPAQRPK